MHHEKITLQAVIFKRNDWWVGQCLEHDIGAEARTPKQLHRELNRALVAHIAVALENDLEPFAGIPEAPRRYWKMFEEGVPMEAPKPTVVVMAGKRRETPAPEVRLSDLVVEQA